MQNRLIHAERFWLSFHDGDDALPIAFELYAALQKAFRSRLSGALPPGIKDSELISSAQEQARKSGLGQLTQSLRTVKQSAIRKTLQGVDQTLGACVISHLIVAETDELRVIAGNHPSLLADVEDIIQKRGHGNQPLPMSRNEVVALRRRAFSIIKSLMEV